LRPMVPHRAQVSLDTRGILRIVHPSGSRIAGDDFGELVALHEKLAGSKPVPVLVDARGVRFMTRLARQTGASEQVGRLTSRMALLIGGPVSTMIGNFFLRVSKPAFEARLFTEMEAAERWLLSGEVRV